MTNEKMNHIIDEAYENYNNYMAENFMETRWYKFSISTDDKSMTGRLCNRDEFIIESKTQPDFSKKWGLKIEERELSEDERNEIRDMQYFRNNLYRALKGSDTKIDWENIPTKLITITHNNETIESYE